MIDALTSTVSGVMRALALVFAASAGGFLGLSAKDRSDAHLGSHQGMYTYAEKTAGGQCVSPKDPINVVFVGLAAWADQVDQHATHHGWRYKTAGGQYFIDHYGQCENMDGTAATKDEFFGFIPQDRYHMRHNQGDIDDALDYDPDWGFYTIASPHHDEVHIQYLPPKRCHFVDEGGFDEGRLRVVDDWISQYPQPRHHQLVHSDFVGNTNGILQQPCNDQVSRSDGYVWYISVEPGSGPGTGAIPKFAIF